MRRIAAHTCAAIIIQSLVFAGIASGEAVQWVNDLEAARATAKAQNKLLLLHFWTPNCAPCKQLDQTVFPNSYVAEAINRDFVALKVNAFRNPELKNHFRVDRYPTDIVATAEGQLVDRWITPQDADRYIHQLMTVASKNRPAAATPRHIAGVQPAQPGTPESSHPGPVASTYQSRWSNAAATPPPASTAQAGRPGIDYRGDQNFASRDFGSRVRTGVESWGPTDSVPPRHQNTPQPASPSVAASGNTSVIQNPYIQGRAPANMAAGTASSQPPFSAPPAGSPPSQLVAQRDVQEPPLEIAPSSAKTPPIGLDGRCPVTLVSKGAWKKGDARWGAIHRGRLYLFSGPTEQTKFLANPDQFSPVLAGMDVVKLAEAGKIVQGDRKFGVLFDDDGKGPSPSRIYLFESADTRNRFEATPDIYLRPVMEALQQGRLHTMLR